MAVSIYVAEAGPVHRLRRLNVATGAHLWSRLVAVGHPRQVLVNAHSVLAVDALPPYQVRLLSKPDGKARVSWAWKTVGSPEPSSDVSFLGADAAVATRVHTGDGVLAHLAVIRLGMRQKTDRKSVV